MPKRGACAVAEPISADGDPISSPVHRPTGKSAVADIVIKGKIMAHQIPMNDYAN